MITANLFRGRRTSLSFVLLAGMLMLQGGRTAALGAEVDRERQSDQENSIVGSWLVTYDVPAFIIPIPILLSFTKDGIIIETDSPAPTPFGGSIGTLFLSNGHGSWKHTGKDTIAYTYRKILYDANGAPFGLVKTNGTVTISKSPTPFKAVLDIRFFDNKGNPLLFAPGTASGGPIDVELQ